MTYSGKDLSRNIQLVCSPRKFTIISPSLPDHIRSEERRPSRRRQLQTDLHRVYCVRHFHRILAKRLERLSLVDARQRAFRYCNGVAENIFLLDALLRDARSSCKGLCLASLDLSKAFDSVSHESISCAMRRVGLDWHFVEYIARTYESSGTFIQSGGQSSRVLHVTKGVRQGDLLSPLLFKLVVDIGLQAIPGEIGFELGD